jgi:hypothetical protein
MSTERLTGIALVVVLCLSVWIILHACAQVDAEHAEYARENAMLQMDKYLASEQLDAVCR